MLPPPSRFENAVQIPSLRPVRVVMVKGVDSELVPVIESAAKMNTQSSAAATVRPGRRSK